MSNNLLSSNTSAAAAATAASVAFELAKLKIPPVLAEPITIALANAIALFCKQLKASSACFHITL